jgi:hypothetical protein
MRLAGNFLSLADTWKGLTINRILIKLFEEHYLYCIL